MAAYKEQELKRFSHHPCAMRYRILTCRAFVSAMLLTFLAPNVRPQQGSPDNGVQALSALVASELTFDKKTHERKLREADAELRTVRESLPKVKSHQGWVFWLGISLIALGLLAACAQLLSDPWNKRVSTVLAALVVAVTTSKSSYFPIEAKVIDGLVAPADDAIKDLEKNLANYREELKGDAPDQNAIKDYLDRLESDRATLLQVHGALRAAGLSLGFATPPVQTSSRPAPSNGTFLRVVHAQTNAVSTVSASGSGESNDAKAAREYARYSALEQLARRAVKDQRRDDLDAVIEYLGGAGAVKLETFHSELTPSGMTRYSIKYSVLPQVLDRTELQVRTQREPFITWASQQVIVSRSDVASGKLRRVVSLYSGKAVLGDRRRKCFDIHLDFSAAGGSMLVDLVQADTHWDGSLGSTRWAFEVLANQQVVISLPNHRYDDVKKPTIYRVPSDEPRRGKVPLADQVTFQVIAYSPR